MRNKAGEAVRIDSDVESGEESVHRLAPLVVGQVPRYEDDGVAVLFVHCGDLAGLQVFHDDLQHCVFPCGVSSSRRLGAAPAR